MQIRSEVCAQVSNKQAEKQTDKQTDKRRLHNLLGGGNQNKAAQRGIFVI